MKISRKFCAWCVGVSVTGQLILGCSSQGEKEPKAVPASTSEVHRVSTSITNPLPDFRLPIQNYIESDRLRHDTATAITEIATECLERKGVRYRPTAPSYVAPPSLMAGRYGPVNMAQAAYGYHFMMTLPSSTPQARSLPRAKEAKSVAGCFTEAQESIPQAGDPELTDKIKDEAYFQAEKVPAVEQVFSQWSQCMAESGYTYHDPEAAMRDGRWNWKSDLPAKSEIAVSMRDVLCKKETGVVKVWFDGEVALEEKEIETNASKLARISAGLKSQQRRVDQVLSAAS